MNSIKNILTNARKGSAGSKVACNAPFVNLNFEQSGDVRVCCYNVSKKVGHIKSNSISEIWNGAAIQEIRSALTEYDFSKGCIECERAVLAGNYLSSHLQNFDKVEYRGAEAIARGPQILEFELSNECNLMCSMCNGNFSSKIRKYVEKLPPIENPYNDEFVKNIEPFLQNCEEAKFLGGEPFLNKLYFGMWRSLLKSNRRPKIFITTNCTVLSEEIKQLILELRPNLICSIDSFKKETYESIRRGASFEAVLNNLSWLEKNMTPLGAPPTVVTCVMASNWLEIGSIVDECNRRNLFLGFNSVFRSENLSLFKLDEEERRKIVHQWSNEISELKEKWNNSGPTMQDNIQRFSAICEHLKNYSSK